MRLLSIACAVAISVPHVAGAGGVGVIAISAGGNERIAVARAMSQVIAGKNNVIEDAVGQASASLAAGAVPIESLQRFRRVREQIEEGWRAYLRVQLDFAQSRLATARTDAEALVALPGGAALYAEAALKLGAVLGHIGRTQEAQAVLALALALDPERPITQAEFSPNIVATVEAVRALSPELQQVTVAIEPAGSSVSIDGKDVGLAPVHVEIARGQHVVVAHAPQFVTRALGFAVDDQTHELALSLERDEPAAQLARGAEPGLPDAATQLLVEATLQFADLDEVVLVADGVRRGEPTLFVQRCVAAPTRCSAIVELGYGNRSGLLAASRAALQDTRSAELRYTPSLFGDPRVTGVQIAKRCELCRSPWLWGGVTAAAVVGTIVVLAVVSGSKPPPIVTVDPMSFTH